MSPQERQMNLIAYLFLPMSHHQGMWRHPYTWNGWLDRRFYESVGRTLEQGLFDMVFMPDTLHIPDQMGGSFEVTVEYGGQAVITLDPLQVMAAIAGATTRLGLAATLSATFFKPYQIARSFASLDHLTAGRAAWNVVMSISDAEAQNFGDDAIPARQDRYDRGDEFMEVVLGLWDSWGEEALILDKETGTFADPRKVHYLKHRGRYLQVRGPLSVPRAPQGRPLLLQAGASARGRDFAAQWGEVIFTLQHSLPDMQAFYRDIKDRVEKAGREPEQVKIIPAVQPVIGETGSIARERADYANSLVNPLAGLAQISYHIGIDLTAYSLDQPVHDVELAGGSRGSFDVILQGTRAENLTLGEAAMRFATSELTPQIVGTPAQVADELEHMFNERGCDGFMITPFHMPGSFEEFARSVVPELQKRGLFRTSYPGTTLRDIVGAPLMPVAVRA
jgi:FMN-dependent oxidoreductase (nitrilotriacetate monooxygenase family)